jgi:hypothetical protein
VIRKFVGFAEAAAMLGSNYIGLRQAFELGLGSQLSAYVYAGNLPLLARPVGPGVEFSAVDIHDGRSGATTIPGFGTLTSVDLRGSNKIGDELGEVTSSDLPQSVTGIPFTLKLRGFFRVAPYALKDAAKEDAVGMVGVAPDSWWAVDSPISKSECGAPAVWLMLLPTNQPGYRELPELNDLQFKIADIEALNASLADPKRESLDAKPLGNRERRNLLRVIRALDAMANLPARGAVTSIEAQLQRLGFSEPREATIRNLIERARALEPDKPQ